MTTAQQKVNEARIAFNRAFYGGGTVEDKCRAAYECSIVYEMTYNTAIANMFEKIGNYWYMQQDKFKTIIHED